MKKRMVHYLTALTVLLMGFCTGAKMTAEQSQEKKLAQEVIQAVRSADSIQQEVDSALIECRVMFAIGYMDAKTRIELRQARQKTIEVVRPDGSSYKQVEQ